jgi:hypothetical protein
MKIMNNVEDWKIDHQKTANNWFSWSVWLYENQERRLDSFKKLALYLFAGNVAILQTFRILTSGINFSNLEIYDFSKFCTLLAGMLCLFAVLPRRVEGVDLNLVRQDWIEFQESENPENQPYGFVENLLQGQSSKEKVNPIQSLSKYSKRIAVALYISIVLTMLSLLVLIVSGVKS